MKEKIWDIISFCVLFGIVCYFAVISNIAFTIFACTMFIVNVMFMIYRKYDEVSFNKFECIYELLCEIYYESSQNVKIDNIQNFNNKN